MSDFERTLPFRREGADALENLPEPQANMSKDAFKKMVETCKEYSPRRRRLPDRPFPALLPALQACQPLSLYPFAAPHQSVAVLIFFDYGDFSIVGSSPEILVAAARQHGDHPARLAGTIRARPPRQ